MFPSVLALIEDNIAKDGSTSTRGISEKEQLMVTLRYLAEGESHKTLSLYFMIGQPTISKCIPKVMTIGHCTWGLFSIHTKVPSSESEWLEVERRFANRRDYVTVSTW